jgi:hypothetical protein
MKRDYGMEIDNVQKELSKIKELMQLITPGLLQGHVKTSANEPHKKVGHIEKMPNMHPDPNITNILDRLENNCGSKGENGCITYIGVFSSGDRQSTWIRNEVNTKDLLALIENKMAGKVLACIGNNDRLNILLSILKKPMSVAHLVTELGYNTTGQVYHHLKPLIAADLVTEDSKNEGKGVYVIKPHRVQGIIMLLAGISDMLDPQYTQGNWEQSEYIA